MHFADSFEGMHAFVEGVDERWLDYRREMDDVTEALVGDGHDRCIMTGEFLHDAVEALEVDRLSSDFYKVDGASKHPQRSTVHFPQILGDEPALDLRIDQALLRRVAGKERRSAEGEASIGSAARFDVAEERVLARDRRAAFRHAVARERWPSAVLDIEDAAADENRAQRR